MRNTAWTTAAPNGSWVRPATSPVRPRQEFGDKQNPRMAQLTALHKSTEIKDYDPAEAQPDRHGLYQNCRRRNEIPLANCVLSTMTCCTLKKKQPHENSEIFKKHVQRFQHTMLRAQEWQSQYSTEKILESTVWV